MTVEPLPGSAWLSLAGASWAWLLALLLGAAVLPRRWRDSSLLGLWLGRAAVGMSLQSLIWLLAGLAGALSPASVTGIAALLTLAAGALRGRRLLAELRERGAGAREPLALACGIMLALFVLLSARFALVPSAYYDDLVYHLGLPLQALMSGSWPAWESFHHALMPAGWDAAYLLPLALGGGSGPQLMNAIGLAGFAAAVWLLARDVARCSNAAAGLATVLLVVSPVAFSLGAFAGSDLFVAFALTLALRRALVGEHALEAGLLAGVACAAKITALPALAGLALAWLLGLKAPAKRRLQESVALGCAGLAVAAPWLLRSWALTGNPLFPGFYSLLGGSSWSAESAALQRGDTFAGTVGDIGPIAFLRAGWNLLRNDPSLGTPSGLNPVFLIVALAGLLLARRVAQRLPLLAVVATCYLASCVTVLFLRFALIQLAGLAVFAALLASWLVDREGLRETMRWALFTLVAVSAGFATVDALERHLALYGNQDAALLEEARSDVLSQRIDLAAAGRDLHLRLPEQARILLVADGRIALMPRPVVASAAFDRPVPAAWLERARTPRELAKLLREDGVTHVVVNDREAARWAESYGFLERLPEGGLELFARMLGEEGKLLGRWGRVAAFTLD